MDSYCALDRTKTCLHLGVLLIFLVLSVGAQFKERLSFPAKRFISQRACQATCVIGLRRTLNQINLNSIHRNGDILGHGCHHLFIVTEPGPVGKPANFSMGEFAIMNMLKDRAMSRVHKIEYDFHPTDSTENISNLYSKSSNFRFATDKGDKHEKYLKCMEMAYERERVDEIKYLVYARARTDATIYAPVTRFISSSEIVKGVVYTSHGDTMWFGSYKSELYTKNVSSPIRFGNEGPIGNYSKYTYLPWVMCRKSGAVGTLYNFLDHFLHQNETENVYGQFCYRVVSLFGEGFFSTWKYQNLTRVFDGQGQPPIDQRVMLKTRI